MKVYFRRDISHDEFERYGIDARHIAEVLRRCNYEDYVDRELGDWIKIKSDELKYNIPKIFLLEMTFKAIVDRELKEELY